MTYIKIPEDVKIKLELKSNWNVSISATNISELFVADFDEFQNFLIQQTKEDVDYYMNCFPNQTIYLIDEFKVNLTI